MFPSPTNDMLTSFSISLLIGHILQILLTWSVIIPNFGFLIGYFSNLNGSSVITLNSPIIMGHIAFLEPMLDLVMRMNVGHINFQPTLYF